MGSFSREQIGDLIRAGIDAFGENAWHINNGWCEAFALRIAKEIGDGAKVVNSSYDYRKGTFPGHCWLEYEGHHFDAETPDGVPDPVQMQYHIRLRAIADSPDDKDEAEAVFEALGHDPIFYGPASEQSDQVEYEEDAFYLR